MAVEKAVTSERSSEAPAPPPKWLVLIPMLALVPCFTQGAIMLSRMSLGEIRAVLAWMGAKLLLGVGIALIAAAFGGSHPHHSTADHALATRRLCVTSHLRSRTHIHSPPGLPR